MVLDPVVDRVGRNDRLGCFVDRLHRLVDDFTTRLDLVDFRSTYGRHAAILITTFCSCTYPAFTRTQRNLVLYLVDSCIPARQWTDMQHAVFHSIAFLAFSCLAYSTPATWCRIFMSRNFMSRIFSVPDETNPLL